jgi:lipoteichoic acid synthase
MTSAPPRTISPALFYFLFILLMLGKAVALTWHLGYDLSVLGLFDTIAVLVLFTSPAFLFGGRWFIGVFLAADVIISIFLLGDSVYHAYFNRIVPAAAIEHIRELFNVSDSVGNLANIVLVGYLLDFIVIIWCWRRFFRTRRVVFPRRSRRWLITAALLGASTLILSFEYRAFTTPMNCEAAQEPLDQCLLARHGTQAYHLFDIRRFNLRTPIVVPDPVMDLKIQHFQEVRKNLNTSSDRYFGMAKGKNVLIVLLESMEAFVIGRKVASQEITPNLNALAREGFDFKDLYSQIGSGSTADAELLFQYSLFPLPAEAVFKNYAEAPLVGLPDILTQQGYGAYVFHGNIASFWNRDKFYQHHGVKKFYAKEDFTLDETIGLGLSDRSFMRQVLHKINTELSRPFYGLIITLTSHYPFHLPESERRQGIQLPQTFATEHFRHYLESMNYVDRAIGDLVNGLKEQGLFDETVLVFLGDHMAITGYLGVDLCRLFNLPLNPVEHFKVPLIIRSPGGTARMMIGTPAGLVDVEPTILHLLGLKPSGVSMGRQLFSGYDPIVPLSRFFLPEGSFMIGLHHLFINGVKNDRRCYQIGNAAVVNPSECIGDLTEVLSRFAISDAVIRSGKTY